MIRLDVEQGSPAWIRARLGLPTASQFHRLMTPKKRQPSEQAIGYRNELIAEWLLGEPLHDDPSGFMERGTGMEADAVAFYEMQREVDVDRAGFLLRDDRRCGCSPDGLVGEDGGLEIKCPSAAVHVGYLLGEAASKYELQIQGALLITGRAWWDFLSYHPTLPPALVRHHRDESLIRPLGALLDAFADQLAATREELLARGIEPARTLELVR